MSDQNQVTPNRLEKELIQRTQKLSALFTVLTAHHRENDLDEIMKLALSQVMEISASNVGTIHLLDDTQETLHLAAHQGLSAFCLKELQQITAMHELFYEIVAHNAPLIISEISKASSMMEIFQLSGWNVFIGVPIIGGKKVWGVLAVYGDQSLQTTTEEINLLEIIAGQIGIAIDSSYLKKQAELLSVMEERNRLARELHDSVTQSIYSLTLFAETAKRMMEAGDMTETRRYLDEIADSSQQALKEMRLLVYKLRPSTHSEGGLIASIQQRLRAVEERSGVEFNFRADKNISFPIDVENALYAIAIEVLNNALKYAHANQVQVKLTQENEIVSLIISDDGQGFDVDRAKQSGGLGLASIQERVEQLQGKIKIDSTIGQGTTIRIRIPNPRRYASSEKH